MKRSILTASVLVLTVSMLILAACQAAPTTTTTPQQTVEGKVSQPTTPAVTTPKPGVTTPVATALPPEQPKFGGEVRVGYSVDNLGWDEAFTGNWNMHHDELVYDTPLQGDWLKGPYGTKEHMMVYDFWPLQYETGDLVEAWSFPDAYTIQMKVREGVHFQNKPPVNGREMTAADIVYSLNRTMTAPQGYQATSYPGWLVSIEATDKTTIVVKAKPGHQYTVAHMWDKVLDTYVVYPKEVIDKFGDLKDWRNQIGTGPFMIQEYVPNSMQYFVRNPNYWMKDPFHPQNQLPYVDAVRLLIIPDASTRIAALRTGKVDWLDSVSWDNWTSLKKTNPRLQELEMLSGSAPTIAMRTSKAPFSDIRVRRALSMAIDIPEIAKSFYGRPAAIMNWNVSPTMKSIYTPLDQMPETAQELFRYSPDKARDLLKEAGFPTGFKTSVIAQQIDVDLLSVVKKYWEDIGVIADIQVVEPSVWTSHWRNHTHTDMMYYNYSVGYPYKLLPFIKGQYHNLSDVDDPYINERFAVIWAFENMQNFALTDKATKEATVRYVDQAYSIILPSPSVYRVWQPWVQNYPGVIGVGYVDSTGAHWAKYAWVDEAMKREMGY